MRLARSYEELRGPDIEGFVRFIRDQEAVGASQLEAVSEEEGADAVRLLTIHAAKGLEFKVVIVADAGPRHGRRAVGRTRSSCARTAASASGSSIRSRARGAGVFSYEEVREAEKRGGPCRAAAPLLRRDDARDRPADRLGRDRPRARADRETPIGWVLARLGADERDRARRPTTRSSSSAATRASCWRSTAGAARRRCRRSRDHRGRRRSSRSSPSSRPGPAPRGYRLPELVPLPAAAAAQGAAAVVLGARALRALLVPLLRRACRRAARGARDGAGRAAGSTATEIGDAVHRLLELVDLRDAGAPGRRERARLVSGGHRRGARRGSRAFVDSYCESRARAPRRDPRGRAAPERPFAFEHDGVLLHGRLDVALARRPARARARLQDELARRGHARGDRRGGLPAAAARLRARVLPRRRRRGRGRLPLPRAAGRRRRRRRSSASELPALEAELPRRSRRSTRASSCRRRASSRARAARRSTSSAPARGSAEALAAAADALAVGRR